MCRRLTVLSGLVAAAIVLAVSGCDTVATDAYEPEYVVEAYLVAGDRLPSVRLSRSVPAGDPYEFLDQAVDGAAVRIERLGPEGEVAERFDYEQVSPGVYGIGSVHRVVPLATYRLDVVPPGGGSSIAASTVVPDTFRLVRASTTSLMYQGPEQLRLDITRSRYPGRDQAFFIFVTEGMDAREDALTPVGRSLYEGSGEATLEELSKVSSPILNEANYEANADGTFTIRYPWLGVMFYGGTRLTAAALDDNLYDLIRTQSVQQQGSTRSPGEIPNVRDHVDGGRGVFGSYARIQFDVFILRNPDVDPEP